MKKIFILTLLCISTLVMGQTKEDPLRIQLGVTHSGVDTWYYENMYDFSDLDNVGFSVGAELYVNPSFNTSLIVSRGKMKYEDNFRALVTDVRANVIYKFNNGYIMKENARVAPFLGIGFGITNKQDQEYFFDEFDGTHAMMPYTGGINFRLNKKVDLMASATWNNTIDDSYNYMQYGLAAKVSLQRDKDKDGDGVLDRNDPCPDEFGPYSNNGCPLLDDDNDGVPNVDDTCPLVPGSINGCPDSDGDMVPNIYDACPNTMGRAENGGCPDTDNDGVVDAQDPCPEVYGEMGGCTQGALEAMLPTSVEVIKVKLIEAAENILFELDKAELTQASYEPLNDILDVLQANPAIKLDINGHADSQGSESYNYNLSKERAETVKQWFVDKGIDKKRLMAEGYGERAPRTDNDTPGERALNRRVDIDFVISNK